jgi:hypothetical protein
MTLTFEEEEVKSLFQRLVMSDAPQEVTDARATLPSEYWTSLYPEYHGILAQISQAQKVFTILLEGAQKEEPRMKRARSEYYASLNDPKIKYSYDPLKKPHYHILRDLVEFSDDLKILLREVDEMEELKNATVAIVNARREAAIAFAATPITIGGELSKAFSRLTRVFHLVTYTSTWDTDILQIIKPYSDAISFTLGEDKKRLINEVLDVYGYKTT